MGSFSIWHWAIILILVPLAFLPTILAVKKNHPYKIPIILINILGGPFYGLGWLFALVWCFILPKNRAENSVSAAHEIDQLHQLKQKGVLTQEEFDYKKKAILTGK